MTNFTRQPIVSELSARREKIAALVLAALVGHAGQLQDDHLETAFKAADELIKLLDSQGVE
jgi:hypothetical protein